MLKRVSRGIIKIPAMKAGSDEIGVGVDRHRFQGIDLLGDFHRPQLGAHRGSDPPVTMNAVKMGPSSVIIDLPTKTPVTPASPFSPS